jgi:hypothetical protein
MFDKGCTLAHESACKAADYLGNPQRPVADKPWLPQPMLIPAGVRPWNVREPPRR